MISLTSELLTNIELIDRQHMVLFERINEVIAMGKRSVQKSEMETTLNLLLAYADKHFTDEEELMKCSGYININWHKEMHRWYYAEILKLIREYEVIGPSEKYRQLLEKSIINWIIKHILNVDMVMAKSINAQKIKDCIA